MFLRFLSFVLRFLGWDRWSCAFDRLTRVTRVLARFSFGIEVDSRSVVMDHSVRAATWDLMYSHSKNPGKSYSGTKTRLPSGCFSMLSLVVLRIKTNLSIIDNACSLLLIAVYLYDIRVYFYGVGVGLAFR